MESVSKLSLNQKSDPLIKEPSPSHSRKSTLKSHLFTNQATHLTSLLTTVNTSKWIHSAKIAFTTTGIIFLGNYVANQCFSKTTPPKLSITPLTLIEPITMIGKALSVLFVIALGTKWFIPSSNDRHDHRDSFESSEDDSHSFDSNAEDKSKKPTPYKHDFSNGLGSSHLTKEELESKDSYQMERATLLIEKAKNQSDESILKSNQIEFLKTIKFFQEDALPKVASSFMNKYIEGNCIIDENLIDLVAQTSPKKLYSLILGIINLKNETFSIKLYGYALSKIFMTIDQKLAILFSDKDDDIKQKAHKQTLALFKPYFLNEKEFKDDRLYADFIEAHPQHGWRFATECIIDRNLLGRKIVEEAMAILFDEDYAGKGQPSNFAIALIQHELKINEDHCSNNRLLSLFDNLYYMHLLESTITKTNNSDLEGDVKKIAHEMILMALKFHKREDLIPLLNGELKEETNKELENHATNPLLQ